MEEIDLYSILELKKDATEEEIQKSYRKQTDKKTSFLKNR